MEFTHPPRQQDLKQRATSLAEAIFEFEQECEEGRGLPPGPLAKIRGLTLETCGSVGDVVGV